MGAECKNMKGFNMSQDHPNSLHEEHPSFGTIFRLRAPQNHTQHALKRLPCRTSYEIVPLKNHIEFVKESHSSVATLIPIFNYEFIERT